jgi:hypothetical protein
LLHRAPLRELLDGKADAILVGRLFELFPQMFSPMLMLEVAKASSQGIRYAKQTQSVFFFFLFISIFPPEGFVCIATDSLRYLTPQLFVGIRLGGK